MGRGGGQVVSMLAFYSDDPNLNSAKAYSFFCKVCVIKTKINKKRPFSSVNKDYVLLAAVI